MNDVYTLELAHAMPGRIRLRWRGEDPPPGDLIDRLRSAPCVRGVESRELKRSVLVLGDESMSVDDLRRAASDAGAEIVDPPEPRPLFERRAPVVEDPKDLLYQDVEAALLVVVMLSWIRDLIVNRVFRLSTVLLVIITAMDLYRHWLRRQAAREDGESAGLEVMGA